MTRPVLLSFLASLIPFCLYAQNPDYHFGKVSMAELEMTSYDQDPDAAALYLNEEKQVGFELLNGNVMQRTDYLARIKILKPAGIDRADIAIDYYVSAGMKDAVQQVEAAAYNLTEGQIVATPLDKAEIFTEAVSEHGRRMKFAIPDVRVGSVIEYRYSILSQNSTDIAPFRIQHDIPVVRSRMQASIPEYYRFHTTLQGFVPVRVDRSVSKHNHWTLGLKDYTFLCDELTAEATDVPALKYEPYVWYPDDFRTQINFEIAQVGLPQNPLENYTTSWADVNRFLGTHSFGSDLRISNPYKEEVAAIVAQGASQEQTAREVLHLIGSKMKWDGTYRLFSDNPKAAAARGEGNSADINFVLAAALKDAGLKKVTPILLNPRRDGRLSQIYPTIEKIRAFILRLDLEAGRQVYLDGTDASADLNVLPVTLSVDRARVYGIDKDDEGWCDLSDLCKNMHVLSLSLGFDAAGAPTGQGTENSTNQLALIESHTYNEAASEAAYREKIARKHGIELADLQVTGVGSDTLTCKYDLTLHTSSAGEYIYLPATIFRLFSKNPLQARSRTLPVEFSLPSTYVLSCSIALPEGYTVEELPKNTQMTIPNGGAACRYMAGVQGSTLLVNVRFSLDRLIYQPAEFADLKTFFGLLADLSNSRIVIRKAPQS